MDTNSIPAGTSNTLGKGTGTYSIAYVATNNSAIRDEWSIGPVAPGTQVTLEYKQIIDAQYASGTATLGNATSGSLVSPINVSFTPNAIIINPDLNSNSIPDVWEMDNFGMLTPADGDPDHDGMNNLLEYSMNTDPVVANKSPVTYSFETVGSEKYLCITYPKNPTATNITYSAETSSDLIHWASDAVKIPINTISEKVRDIVPISISPQRFIRLKVTTAPASGG